MASCNDKPKLVNFVALLVVVLIMASVGATATADDCTWQCTVGRYTDPYTPCGTTGEYMCEKCTLSCPGEPENPIP